ncbi:hypothetical protein [Citrobacter sp. wls718]|uniref:hypothetical protein n=1 Tax=Citrobacter sp. wls718 TaxID=2576418 RepID=UPI000E011C9A|nr:hypothetical protein [Citrobacter sp. wls718]TKU25810.1 hypothetical protein FDW95_17685 [Citrobacter sp. wls718]STE15678.1 Uncharacterised protein [Escherichia coli]STF58879.1 Uncharacterised protein [Escherichia coli]
MSFTSNALAKSIAILSPILMLVALGSILIPLTLEIKDKATSIVNVSLPTSYDKKIDTDHLMNEISTYRDEIFQVRNTLSALKNTSTLTPDNIRIEALEVKVDDIQKKISALNNILGNSPEKAMALPLMKKDMESLSTSLKVMSDYSDKQLERFITLFYWIIGVLAAGIISIAAGLYFGLKKTN